MLLLLLLLLLLILFQIKVPDPEPRFMYDITMACDKSQDTIAHPVRPRAAQFSYLLPLLFPTSIAGKRGTILSLIGAIS